MHNEFTSRKVFIRSFGCQMNVRDSEVVKGLLAAEGYAFVDREKDADIVLFNTCSVRQHAEDKVWSAIGKLRKPKTANRKPMIGVIGCMAQNYKQEILKRAPAVDVVCGPSSIDNIALYLEEAIRTRQAVVGVSEKKRNEEIYRTGYYEAKDHAYVVISEGCDNYCSYCVVPYVRGRLRHRPAAEILKEVEAAAASGIRNITLLGQNVNSYRSQAAGHKPEVDFIKLLQEISEIDKLKSLSFITSQPKDTKKELFELMAATPVIKPSLHMPVQSGSDRILKAMNRGYTAKHYLKIVDQYRSLVYNSQIGTDIIVGFPGETDGDFKKTVALVERVRFDSAYIFKYSPRPHTKAAGYEDDVPMAVKKKRHAELLKLQKQISKEKKAVVR